MRLFYPYPEADPKTSCVHARAGAACKVPTEKEDGLVKSADFNFSLCKMRMRVVCPVLLTDGGLCSAVLSVQRWACSVISALAWPELPLDDMRRLS